VGRYLPSFQETWHGWKRRWGSYIPVLRIRDVYPGSECFHPGSTVKKIPDPHQRFEYCKDKKCFYALGKMIWMFIPDLDTDFFPSWIPDPEIKKAPDPESGSATLIYCS
jgi:hypothetical protein